jgi:AraC family L-rhamnose operon regulatory protein RhaS
MRRLTTVGENNNKGYELLLIHSVEGVFNCEIGFMERYKIVFVEKGTGILRIGENKHLFMAPAIFCFNETDQYTLECCSDLKSEALWFHPGIINDTLDFEKIRGGEEKLTKTQIQDKFWIRVFFDRKDSFYGKLNLGPGLAKRTKDIITSISDELKHQNDCYWPCRSRSYLIELLFFLTRIADSSQRQNNVTINNDYKVMEDLILYLNTNYMGKITIEDLSKTFHMNRTTLNKLFNKVTGIPVKAYLIKLRLHLASQILEDTTVPISEVINRVGFNDPVHFSRIFKKNYGYTPTEYRQKNCWMLK